MCERFSSTCDHGCYHSLEHGLSRAVQRLRAQERWCRTTRLAHVAPLGSKHIGLTGDYVWTAAPFRLLREVRATFQPLAA